MIILGLNAFHGDSSACLVKDGVMLAAIEEERLRRVKHWAGFPSQSIQWCLDATGLTIADVDIVAINQDSSAQFGQKIKYLIQSRPSLSLVLDRLKNRGKRAGVAELMAQQFPGFRGTIEHVEHHFAHLSSAFHVSPFAEASVVSVDGFGDFASGCWGYGKGTDISVEGRVHFPHSLGIFYQAMTQYLGFPHYGDEYKVMGLAPYGQPLHLDKMRQIVRLNVDGSYALNLDYFRHHKEGVTYTWDDGIPAVGALHSDTLADLLGPPRDPKAPLEQYHKDLARSVQAMYEEAFFNLLDRLYERHGSPNICVAGGCGMNSVANGKIRRQTKFENVYVQSAAGDAGGAIGAAFAVWHRQGNPRSFVMDHAYWGPWSTNDQVDALLTERLAELDAAGCRVERFDDEAALCARTAQAVADGKVIGWFQGRLEWGRARSATARSSATRAAPT